MGDLKKTIEDLSQRRISRQQFLMIIGGSIFGMLGFFRFMQAVSTPDKDDLSQTDKGVFGEREYGHSQGVAKASKKFNQGKFS